MDAPDQAKLFVGGISWDTNEETLRDHFKKYGDVVDSVIMRDRNTGSTRGFGFVLFSDSSASDKALQDRHVISGRTVEVKKAVPRGEQQNGVNRTHSSNNNNSSSNNTNNNSSSVQFRTKKIFVGGLSSNLREEEFKGYFEKFGKITDVVVMYDSATHRPRGFGFITFDSEEAVENVMQKSFHELNDKLVEVKRAVPKDGNLGNHQNSSGRISGRGGYLYSNNHAAGIYSPYGPRYGVFLGYAPPSPIPGYGNGRLGGYLPPVGGTFGGGGGGYGGGYAIGGYGGIPPQAAGYGAGFANGPPVGPPRSPWNGPGIVSPSRTPGPFGSPVYPYVSTASPGYMNGGRFISTSAGFHDSRGAAANSNGKWNHGSHDSKPTVGNSGNTGLASQPEGCKLDDHSSGYAGNNGSAGKQNQRGTDSRFSRLLQASSMGMLL